MSTVATIKERSYHSASLIWPHLHFSSVRGTTALCSDSVSRGCDQSEQSSPAL